MESSDSKSEVIYASGYQGTKEKTIESRDQEKLQDQINQIWNVIKQKKEEEGSSKVGKKTIHDTEQAQEVKRGKRIKTRDTSWEQEETSEKEQYKWEGGPKKTN